MAPLPSILKTDARARCIRPASWLSARRRRVAFCNRVEILLIPKPYMDEQERERFWWSDRQYMKNARQLLAERNGDGSLLLKCQQDDTEPKELPRHEHGDEEVGETV
eukprot:scaffold1541_cov256-Pinguiococcus_pyrenoidosus.AAC.10